MQACLGAGRGPRSRLSKHSWWGGGLTGQPERVLGPSISPDRHGGDAATACLSPQRSTPLSSCGHLHCPVSPFLGMSHPVLRRGWAGRFGPRGAALGVPARPPPTDLSASPLPLLVDLPLGYSLPGLPGSLHAKGSSFTTLQKRRPALSHCTQTLSLSASAARCTRWVYPRCSCTCGERGGAWGLMD